MKDITEEKLASEFTMRDPSKYKFIGRMMGPDRMLHNAIFHKEKYQNAYIVKQRNLEDMSFYAPYILNKIGKKTGIKTPETELGLFIVLDEGDRAYSDSFFHSSCVFLENSTEFDSENMAHISPEVTYAIYNSLNPEEAKKHRDACNNIGSRALPMTIDEYIDSNIFMLTSRGNKPQEEYTPSEIKQMKQELIDRAVLGLKLGVTGETEITTFHNKYARLSPYYLSSRNMFGLNCKEYELEDKMLKADDEFEVDIDKTFPVQFGMPPNIEKPTSKKVLKYLFDKYPEETEKAYKKVELYTLEDLETELNSYTILDDVHKKFALRFFETKNRQFEQVYDEYLKDKSFEDR